MKRLLLVGGGHSHVEVVRRFGIVPPPGTEVTLISSERHMPYSGMLPGHIAGHYGFHDMHVDLERLCRFAGIRFAVNEATGLDPIRRLLHCRDGGVAAFDILSLDIGSTPDVVPGAATYAISVKPVPRLLQAWERILLAARQTPQSIVIVGGGAGGVELALAMEHRLRNERLRETTLAVVTDHQTLLPQHPPAAARLLERCLEHRAIALHRGSRVEAVEDGALLLQNGRRLAARWVVWATSASAQPWPASGGLETDARGFVMVDDTLRSTSHPCVFASGDCAHVAHRSLPKSGVYAVRQGPVLAENLKRAARGAGLERYHPQRRALALISTGDRHAVATWGRLAFSGQWVWRWKDRIDRRFMAAFRSGESPA